MLMAAPLLSNPLTNPLLYARSLMHTLLSHNPAILLLEKTNSLIIKGKKILNVKMSKPRRVSGLGKGHVINHYR